MTGGDICALYKEALESIPDGVVIVDARAPDMPIIFCNDVFEQMTGYAREEVLGRNCRFLQGEETEPATIDSLRGAIAQGQPCSVRLINYRKDGSRFYNQLKISPVRDATGALSHYIGVQTDVTAQVQAEQSLRESQERYDLAVRGSSDGIWDWDPQTDMAYFSPRFRELMGYASEDQLGGFAALAAVVHPDDLERTVAALNAHFTARQPYQVEYRLRTVAGEYRWFLVRGQAIWDERGRPIRMAGSLTDIHDGKMAQLELEQLNRTLEGRIAERTAALQQANNELRREVEDRERAERELARNLRFTESVLSATPAIVYLYDLIEQRNIRSNHAILEVLGYTPEEIQAMGSDSIGGVMHPDDFAALGPHWARLAALPDGEILENEYRMRSAGGEWRWIYGQEQIFERLPDGRPRVVLGVASDITVRKQHEEHLQRQSSELSRVNAQLARAAQLKDEFLAGMSHELRTPLNAILGYAELLSEQLYGPLGAEQLEALAQICASGRHLLALINDILDVAKIEAGYLSIEAEPVSVPELCQSALRLIAQSAKLKQLRVVTQLDPQVQQIMGDGRRLLQILVNLLSNAVKFTPTGGALGLDVRGDTERQQAVFSVWDTGIGITPADRERLFQPFVQIDSSLAREHTGTGLGLALVKQLAELHGGSVRLESEPGLGTRVTVVLPWDERAAVLDAPPAPQQDEAPPLRGAGKTLLLVEDNAANKELLTEYLQRHDYRIVWAQNGYQALDLAQTARPDMILMDIQLPGLDGLTTIRRLRADASLPQVPIIALTALAMPEDRQRCLDAGADAYMSKPLQLSALLRQIAELLALPLR